MDRAEAEPVAHDGLAVRLRVGDDVGGVQEADLLQPADRALAAVRGDDAAAEPCLVEPHLDVADDVATLDRIVEERGLLLVHGPHHLALRDEHHPCSPARRG
ncbi:MAG: hypothetical protein ACRDOG_15415 [Gaiellaceae bacterium]